jgi:hypothetical protein
LVDGAGRAIPPVRVLALHGCATHQLAYMVDSLVRVSRRADDRPSASMPGTQFQKDSESDPQPSDGAAATATNSGRWCPATPTDADRHPAPPASPRARMGLGAQTACHRFPFDNFKYFLTLFSKCFSPFPHGTCSLSVSRQYSAFDGIYHRLWAAFPNNPTLRTRSVERHSNGRRGSHPFERPFPGNLGRGRRRRRI